MKIQLINAGKRYNYSWILKDINFEFTAGKTYGITGANGVGKTTLLSVIAGYYKPSQGQLLYTFENKTIEHENIYNHVSWASPALDLIEEFTLLELINYQKIFKPFINSISVYDIIEIVGLQNIRHKTIKEYSTGMKQRVKVVLALLADTKVVLLDEPTSNFDVNAINWYTRLIETYQKNRIFIIASNNSQDFVNVNAYLNL
jgi:ABC-type multidrug transport system ATPase subunit